MKVGGFMVSKIYNLSNSNLLQENTKYFIKTPDRNLAVTTPSNDTKLTKSQKLGINICTIAGISSTLALLAKTSKTPYSFNIKKIVSTPFKNSFLGKVDYNVGQVALIGAGSCLGGYIGGLIFDKNKKNRQAKMRETLIQYTNITLPIATVAISKQIGKQITRFMPNNWLNSSSKLTRIVAKSPEILLPLAGLGIGMYIGNRAANKINQSIFKNNDDRPVMLTDMSAHLDDICLTSKYIAEDNIITKVASRFIPLTLIVAGSEIGKKQEKV